MTPDIIPHIPDAPATYDSEGNELTPATYKPGYHVNFREPVPGLEEFRVYPTKPTRVYAGGEPVCYRFADEAEFRSHFPEPEEPQDD
jgi:hypothetical protein